MLFRWYDNLLTNAIDSINAITTVAIVETRATDVLLVGLRLGLLLLIGLLLHRTQKRSNARAIRLECDCRGRTANEHPVYGDIFACAIRYTYITKLTFWRVNTKE